MKIYWHDDGHITKMADMPIYCKNLSKIFLSGTSKLISTKLGMSHLWHLPIIVCSNDDRRLTLTYFTAKSNLVTGLSIGKVKTVIFQNFCSLWPENNWDNEDMWVLKFKVIYIRKFKPGFSQKWLGHFEPNFSCAWPKYQVSVSQDHWSSGSTYLLETIENDSCFFHLFHCTFQGFYSKNFSLNVQVKDINCFCQNWCIVVEWAAVRDRKEGGNGQGKMKFGHGKVSEKSGNFIPD